MDEIPLTIPMMIPDFSGIVIEIFRRILFIPMYH